MSGHGMTKHRSFQKPTQPRGRMAKRKKQLPPRKKRETHHCLIGVNARGVRIQLPKSDYLSPMYSRRQVKSIIADLQSALDGDLFAA